MRLDRFITLNVVHPFRKVFRTESTSRVKSLPVLMYHSISDDPETGVRPYYRVCTSPDRFHEQLQWLKTNGYRGVTLSDGLAGLRSGPAIGNRQSAIGNPKLVALTFDDGFQDFYTAAWPVLREFDFAATMFLATAFIGDPRRRFQPATLNPQPATFRECLTWPEVRELHAAGVEFGSHTVNHPRLVDCDWPEIEHELRASKSELEQRLGEPVRTFAYPFAFPQGDPEFSQGFRRRLVAAGYDGCVTTEIGRAQPGDDAYALKRLPVNSADDAALLQAKLAGSYDWLARPQKLVKQFKRRLPGPAKSKTGRPPTPPAADRALSSRTSD